MTNNEMKRPTPHYALDHVAIHPDPGPKSGDKIT